jgi:hypothetical protein
MPDTVPVVPPLIDRLIRAQIAGCECATKTPDPQYHDGLCRYRLCHEACTEIWRLEAANTRLRANSDFMQRRCEALAFLHYGPRPQ